MMCETCGIDHTIPAERYPIATLNRSFKLHHQMYEKGFPMSEQEYRDKLAVREQLSQFDRLRLLEYEFNLLIDVIPEQQRPMGLIRPKKEETKEKENT